MKILYVGLYDFEARTAPVQRVRSNTKLLQELGHTVIHLSNGKPLPEEGLWDEEDQCRHYHFSSDNKIQKVLNAYFSPREIIAVLKKEAPVDAVILYNYHAGAMYGVMRYCAQKNIRVLADTTEWYQYYNLKDILSKGIDSVFRMRVVQLKLDGLIVISRYMKDYYQKRGVPTALVPPLIDYENKKWNVAPAVLDEKPSLVAIATADKHKDNLAAVVQLLHKVHLNHPELEFHLNVIGMDEAKYKAIFDPAGVPETIADRVTFCGRVSHDRVLEYTRNAWFSIFLREQNLANNAGFPSKIAESLACGTPVITNPTSSISEYIQNGHNGFLLSGDTVACAEQLGKALSLDRQTVADMHTTCLQERLFDCRKYAPALEKILR